MSLQHKLLWIWLGLASVVLIWAASQSEGAYGGADSFMHYLISRYSWEDPNLFLHHWGKPIFTIISSPFAQLGFFGVRVFNILCALGASYLAFKTAKSLGVEYPIFAAILTLVATLGPPVYLSGLTEPLFGLTLILAVYLVSRSRLGWSALIISFIPLIRSEGVIFIPLWLVILGISRSWKLVPLLATGIVTFSLFGWVSGIGLFWLLTESPYGTTASYGSGEILHFWNYREETFGAVFIFLFFFGVGWLASQRRLFMNRSSLSLSWILILASFFGYFAAHSIVWWLGTGSSAGLTRVMLGIVPIGAVIASASTQATVFIPKGRNIVAYTLAAFTIAYQGFHSLSGSGNVSIPSKWGVEEVALQEVVNYLEENDLSENYIVYFNPIVAFMMSLNPFNSDNSREKVSDNHHPENDMPINAIVIYDNHFAPVEGNLPMERLSENDHFKLLHEVPAPFEHRMQNGDWYTVYVYQKVR